MQYRDEVPHPDQMRVYLFRKLLAHAGELQREVSEEAIAEVVDQVLGGRTSTVFNCGGVPAVDPADMVTRILGELFTSVYSMEVNLEVHVSVRHVQLSGDSDDLVANLKGCSQRATRDHFVATPREVHAYIERVMGKVSQGDDCPHLIFTIHVRQTNAEQSWKSCGKLQLVHLQQLAEDSPPLESDSPLDTLVNLFQALAHNPKTHIRYHNIRLTRLLQQLMGSGGRTVLINYTDPPMRRDHLVTPAPSPSSNSNGDLPAEVWWGLFRQERGKYCRLRDKVMGMVAEKDELDEFLESLEASDSPEEERRSSEDDLFKKKEACLMHQKMLQIRSEAEMSIDKLQDLQLGIDHLAQRNFCLEQQLGQKNRQLERQTHLLRLACSQIADQRRKFQEKMAEYSNLFQDMWQQQSLDIQQQEQVQQRQMSQLFDNICQEMQRWHQRKEARMSDQEEEPRGRP
ncbi:kinesin heavy chain [Drosophila rhopaloa]|uniref:Kinesin heavy chain n=1 Tax=Drosophila rhopaloa TaxID=1041015 RepID=A0ABM5HL15_DRORH|nr:kinesin heavy chain [Drosophila rhopaloa]